MTLIVKVKEVGKLAYRNDVTSNKIHMTFLNVLVTSCFKLTSQAALSVSVPLFGTVHASFPVFKCLYVNLLSARYHTKANALLTASYNLLQLWCVLVTFRKSCI